MKYSEITVQELKLRMDKDPDLQILDVREAFEVTLASIEGTIRIPMNSVPSRIEELDPNKELIIHCKSGIRSARVCDYLANNNFIKLVNVKGGIKAWSLNIDDSVPLY